MKYLFLGISLFFIIQCQVSSIEPSAGGLEMNIDLSKMDVRHGWVYRPRPSVTETIESNQDSIDRGEKLYQSHCSKCHGEQGKGDGELAKVLNLKPADLHNLPMDLSRTYVIMQVNEGKGSMPAWKDVITDQQAIDVTNYVKSLSRKNKK